MNIDTTTILYLLLGSNALLAAAVSIAVIRFRRRAERLEAFWSSPTGSALRDRSESQSQAADRRLLLVNMRLERQLASLEKRIRAIGALEPKPAPAAERRLPMDNALRMAQGGASAEELTRTCGLNIGEARLMTKLHGKAARAAVA